MVNHNDLTSKVQTGAIGWLGLITFFVVVLAAIYVGALQYQSFIVTRALNEVDQETQTTQTEIGQLKTANVEAVFKARKTLDEIEGTEIVWSQVIKKLLDTTPAEVLFRSYSGSEQGDVLISALSPSFEAAAKAIKLLGEANDFGGVFAPTITKGLDNGQQTTVSFSLRLKYLGAQKVERPTTPAGSATK